MSDAGPTNSDEVVAQRPIGIFDSGIGGLSIWREIQRILPYEQLLYVADQAHVPYGRRPLHEIQQFSQAITQHLLAQNAKLIVVACNTASAAALNTLRQSYPTVPFVGMEPAVKPAARLTRSGHVGVLATAGTFASQRYADLMARYAQGVTLVEDPCVGLVEQIESGQIDSPDTRQMLHDILHPMLDNGVDTLVLGCTHYPFVIPMLQELAGPATQIIDPAPAVARQVARVLQQRNWLRPPSDMPPKGHFTTTGEAGKFARQIDALLGESWPVATAVIG